MSRSFPLRAAEHRPGDVLRLGPGLGPLGAAAQRPAHLELAECQSRPILISLPVIGAPARRVGCRRGPADYRALAAA